MLIALFIIIGFCNKKKSERVFLGVLFCNAFVLVSDAVARIFKGKSGSLNSIIVHGSNFAAYLLGYLLMISLPVIFFVMPLVAIYMYIYLILQKQLNQEQELKRVKNARMLSQIQPILENAVKHGVMEKLHGGLIILHTYCKDNCAVISISDDGVGFNPASNDGEDVGLKNVRFRMECIGGSLKCKI